ncbi:MAG: hypothetical protein IKW89_02600 [Bacteroidales bacterium]|nr:hypothetical protein [Bacteroidales bacterium]
MNNPSILHVLSAKPGGTSALFVNGVESETQREEIQKIVDLSFQAGKHRSPWCGFLNGHFFLKGCFEDKDENGNEMSFTYCSRVTRFMEGKSMLLHDLESIGYKLNAETRTCLDNQSRYNQLRKIGFAVFVIAFIVALIAIICINSKNSPMAENNQARPTLIR